MVYVADGLKVVSCFWDKQKRLKCQVSKQIKVQAACMAFSRRKTRHNPMGIVWGGKFNVENAARQTGCCVATAKQCGNYWRRFFSNPKSGRQKWATPKGLLNIGIATVADL